MNAATIPAAMTARPSGTGSRQNGAFNRSRIA